VLFLDEAFDQLDLGLEQQITDRLRKAGLGIVIVSHRPDTVRTVDRVVRLGKADPTVAAGNPTAT
jgi:ATP-binding cassette subfamily B protein RaxB